LEASLFFIIIFAFVLLTILKLPRGISFFLISMAVLLLSEKNLPIHILVNGAFGYFDAVMTVLCAVLFITAIEKSGLLKHIATVLTTSLGSKPRLLIMLTTILSMSGGMITGSSSSSILTTGAVAFPIFKAAGLDNKKAGTLVMISGVLGMIAPPLNIQAMVICEGVDMPYVGFTYPLLWLTVPAALIFALLIAGRDLRSPAKTERVEFKLKDLLLYLPLIFAIVLSVLDSLSVIQIGLPLIFFASAVLAVFCSGKMRKFLEISLDAMDQALPILAILVGIGMLIEVMTLTGVRGFIVANMLFFPYAVLFLSVGLGTPAFGAISSYGAASVLGIPFLLAFRGGNDVLIASSISLLAGLGDILPPTALASTLAAQVSGLDSYMEVLKRSLGFLLTTMVLCVTFIAYSIRFAKIFANPWWFILVVGMIFLVATILDKTERKEK